MGGRGASSGTSVKGNRYGSQYHAVYQSGNIKFVTKNARDSETLMETMTRGRVYVHVEGDELKSVVYFDNDGRRSKQIDLDHVHKGETPHTHHGYNHSENDSAKGAAGLTTEERAMVDRVRKLWNNRSSGK
jgi:hypothetical protein